MRGPDVDVGEIAAVTRPLYGTGHLADKRNECVADDLPASPDTVEELRSLVAASLASYTRVAEVTFVDQIPRLPSGKVLRRELKAGYARPSA